MGNRMIGKIKHMLALNIGKMAVRGLKFFNKGATSFPGKIALFIDNSFLKDIDERCDKIILVTGTNGKTTSNNLINHLLDEYVVLSNLKGANMNNGVAAAYIKDTREHYDYGIFEVDEGSLDFVSRYLKPDYILLTNFFRDQLDRYGEIEGIINEVLEDVKLLPQTTLIINADDPYVNQFREKVDNKIISFGSNLTSREVLEKNLIINKCPVCGEKLTYEKNYYGHIGVYSCSGCGFNNHNKDYMITDVKEYDSYQEIEINNSINVHFPYIGLYNAYNVCGAYALLNQLQMGNEDIVDRMSSFSFNLGRMEEFTYKNRTIKVILTKNPIGLSQVTGVISNDSRSKAILHILNDNEADGRDISWIWDANTECVNDDTVKKYYCSGKRAEDIALKKKYDDVNIDKIIINNDMYDAIDVAMEEDVEILYVLPTYTAIFDTRDYISGKVKK